MAIRWQGPISIPESLYITLPSVGLGIVTSTQFTALNIRAPKARAGSAVSVYLLCQQLGVMLGISSSTALVHVTFRNGLFERLASSPNKDKVWKTYYLTRKRGEMDTNPLYCARSSRKSSMKHDTLLHCLNLCRRL